MRAAGTQAQASEREMALGHYRVQDIREAITAMYEQHNPAKLASIEAFLARYAGREALLYRRVCHRYGVLPNPVLLLDISEEAQAAEGRRHHWT